jgi:hypothetical protein
MESDITIGDLIDSAICEAISLHQIQNYERHFKNEFYVYSITTLFKIANKEERFEKFQLTLFQLNEAEKKILQHVYKKVEDAIER